MDFDKVRWKLADDLTVDEANLIVQNKDKLNDEEKAAFSQVLLSAEPLADNPLEAAIEKAVDDPANQDPAAVIQDPANPVAQDPANPTAPAQAAPVAPVIPAAPAPAAVPDNVVTQDKLDEYLAEKKKEWDAAGKTAAEQEAAAKQVQQFFDAGYAPKDWNDYTNTMLEKVAPLIEQRVLATLEKRNAEFEKQQSTVRKTQEEIYKRFEGEFATLATNKLIPDPKEKPDEYKKAHEQILALGDAHGKTNVTDAYKLWAIIPVEHGGGLATTPAAPVADPAVEAKRKADAAKAAAGRIGSGRGAPGAPKAGPPAANYIHNTSMEDLIDQRLQQP